jgi:hypothetical protein
MEKGSLALAGCSSQNSPRVSLVVSPDPPSWPERAPAPFPAPRLPGCEKLNDREATVETAIRIAETVIKRLEDAWNAGDGAAFGAPFALEADFVTLRGDLLSGEEIAIKGSRHGNFSRALDSGNLTIIRAAAAELTAVSTSRTRSGSHCAPATRSLRTPSERLCGGLGGPASSAAT